MKFKKVAALCRQSGFYNLRREVSEDGELIGQWLGDNASLYLLEGFPTLTESSLCSMLDLTEKQRENCSFRDEPIPATINVNDTDEGERIAEREPITIVQNGHEYIPLRGRNGIILIDARYLEPLLDVAEHLELYERQMSDGAPYIVGKCGLFLVAVILPRVNRDKKTVESLEYIAAAARAAFEANQQGGEPLD